MHNTDKTQRIREEKADYVQFYELEIESLRYWKASQWQTSEAAYWCWICFPLILQQIRRHVDRARAENISKSVLCESTKGGEQKTAKDKI